MNNINSAKNHKLVLAVSNFLDRKTFKQHLYMSFMIRLAFVLYAEFQDRYVEVPFTDIDYRVVTDGARYILNEQSPYKRHTYRYTPFLAYLLTGNIYVHSSFGKILFSICDILIGILIRRIIIDEHLYSCEINANSLLRRNRRESSAHIRSLLTSKHKKQAAWASLLWLYNPLAIIIATRGNGDSITSLFILVSIFALQRSIRQSTTYSLAYITLAGVFHGLAIHFRLYPITFSLTYYLYLRGNNTKSKQHKQTIFDAIFDFNQKQNLLIFSTLFTLVGLTMLFYRQYGYEFLYETYLYHLVRKDTRHNFSLYFYMNLLNTKPMLIEKFFTFLPQLAILLSINTYFGMHREAIGFCIFLQSFVVVCFNPVVTSQYFIWYLAIFPLCLKNLKSFKLNQAYSCCSLWIFSQAFWLYSGYLLEFRGWNTFGVIWMMGAIFFAVNCFIMKVLVHNFSMNTDS